MPYFNWITTSVLCTGLAACGNTTTEQAIFGAGAGAGAAILLNVNPVATVALGAAGNVLYCQQYPGKC